MTQHRASDEPATPHAQKLRTGDLLRNAMRRLIRPPFSMLLLLSLAVSFVSSTFADDLDEFDLLMTIVLLFISAFLQIAVILAASDPSPDRSADAWVKEAFRRRVLLKFVLASFFSIALMAAGLLALVIPAFFIAGMVSLAPMSAVLENTGAGDSLRRSIELSRAARLQLSLMFSVLVLAPYVGLQALYLVGDGKVTWPLVALELLSVCLLLWVTIALTQAFSLLGGRREPRAQSSRDR